MRSTPTEQENLLKCVAEYTESRDSASRMRLIEQCYGYSVLSAERVAGPEHRHIQDLKGEATVALVEAIDGYDPGRGVPFTRYLVQNLRWAVKNELTRIKRSQRERIEDADQEAFAEHPPGAGRERIKDPGRFSFRSASSGCRPTRSHGDSMEGSLGASGGEGRSYLNDTLGDPRQRGPVDDACFQEVREVVMSECDETEKELIKLRYFEGLSQKEIAERLGLTEGRISQLSSGLMRKLRGRLEDKEQDLRESVSSSRAASSACAVY